MSGPGDKPEDVPDPDLETLLDDALEDFSRPVAASAAPQPPPAAAGTPNMGGQMLTEEDIQKATQNFEASMRAIMAHQQKMAATAQTHQSAGPGESSQFDVSSLTSQFNQFTEAASRVAASSQDRQSSTAGGSEDGEPDLTKLLSAAMEQLAQNGEDLKSAPSADEMSKLLEGMGLDNKEGEDGALFPLMQSMLENILSREILYPPLKEMVQKFPDWLAENASRTEKSDFDRYNKQYDIMRQVVELFESERESDSDEVKGKRFESLVSLMQKLQEQGHPPKELSGEVPADMSEMFGGAQGGLPDMSGLLGSLGKEGEAGVTGEQCCVM